MTKNEKIKFIENVSLHYGIKISLNDIKKIKLFFKKKLNYLT